MSGNTKALLSGAGLLLVGLFTHWVLWLAGAALIVLTLWLRETDSPTPHTAPAAPKKPTSPFPDLRDRAKREKPTQPTEPEPYGEQLYLDRYPAPPYLKTSRVVRPTRYASQRYGGFDYPQDFLSCTNRFKLVVCGTLASEEIYEAIYRDEHRHTASGAYQGCEGKALRIITSPNDPVTADNTQALLSALARSNFPWITFALTGTRQLAYCVFTAPTTVLEQLFPLISTFYPNTEPEWIDTSQDLKGLYRSIRTWRTRPAFSPVAMLTDYNPDPYSLFLSTMEQLGEDEALAFVVSFRPLRKARGQFFNAALGHIDSSEYFSAHRVEIVEYESSTAVWKATVEKFKQTFSDYKTKFPPLWDVDLFTLAFAASRSRATHLNSTLGQVLGVYDHPWKPFGKTYSLISDTESPGDEVWYRNVFNTAELAGFLHFPHKSVTSPILMRTTKRRKPAPDYLTQPDGLLLGENTHFGTTKTVRLPDNLRSRHLYVVGASGSGKSTLLINLIKQDIQAGAGFAVIDPHGDLVADTLPHIPAERSQDVIHFNPADRAFVTPLNVLAASTPEEQSLVADAVIVSFRRLVESWGDRMEHILRLTVYTLLAAGGKTFADIERMLIDPEFRDQVVASITNLRLLQFWKHQFPALPKNALDPITNKFSKFINPLDTTGLTFQLPDSKIYFPDILQQRKIFLANLSQGQLGLDTSLLLGTLIISQLQLAAMRRASMPAEARVPFTLYVDEFQNYTAEDASAFEKILSEARKYNLQLVLAHQFTSQLNRKVLDAIIGNVHTKVVFRVGVDDAAYLQRAFLGYTPDDLQNFSIGEAAAVCGKAEDSFNLKTYPPPPKPADHVTEQIIADSLSRYAVPTQQAEEQIAAQYAEPPAAAAADEEEDFGRA